jgi:membrane-bound ClpP family serine protease
MARHHLINGVQVAFTAEEETARDAEEAQAVIDTEARDAAEVARKANVASAKTKLQNLGLTVDEVKDAFNI